MRNLLILLGYAVSVVIAIPFTFGWSWLLHHMIEGKSLPPPVRIKWIPLLIGLLERAIITTLIGWDIPGTATFIIGWIALKSAGAWIDMRNGAAHSRARFYVGLLGTLLSLLFALIGGLILLNSSPSTSSDSEM